MSDCVSVRGLGFRACVEFRACFFRLARTRRVPACIKRAKGIYGRVTRGVHVPSNLLE